MNTYTPLQIKNANRARRLLKSRLVSYNKPQIQDDRRVKQPNTPYILFATERYNSGDFKNMATGEVGKLQGQEWKALSESTKAVRILPRFMIQHLLPPWSFSFLWEKES